MSQFQQEAPTDQPPLVQGTAAPTSFRPLAGRAFLTHMRLESLAPLTAAEEISRALVNDSSERPEKFRSNIVAMHHACQQLIGFLGDRLADPQLNLDAPNFESTLQTLRHKAGNQLHAIGSYCQLLMLADEGMCFGAFAADLQAVSDCLALALTKIRRLTTISSAEELAEVQSLTSEAIPCSPGVVLVVDDNDISRLHVMQLLQAADHTVLLAHSGRQAMHQLDLRDDIDLVLLDINMQDMDGYEVLAEMRRETDWQQIPVVMISAIDNVATIARCIAMGADDYLPKPIDFRMLRAHVASSLAQRRLRRQQNALLREVNEGKKRREGLLRQLFPYSVVQELLAERPVPSRRYPNVAVMFCDLVGFTAYCDSREPEEVVSKLRLLFEEYEQLVEHHGVEKIKTIGDCFMAASGMYVPSENPVLDCVRCAEQMIAAAQRLEWNVRIGIHSGPVVVGLVGRRQYCFDLWGDTVNTSSRVQGEAAPGAIVLSSVAWRQVTDQCRGEDLGWVEMKGKPPMQLFRHRKFKSPGSGN